MANEKRLIYLEDAIEKIVNFPSKVAHDNFYGKKQFSPMQMLTVIAERQHEIIDLLEKLKTVDAVEVVHGRWEDMYDGKYANPRFRCSVCKEKSLFKDERNVLGNWIQVQALTPFCPQCGAALDGGNNNDI